MNDSGKDLVGNTSRVNINASCTVEGDVEVCSSVLLADEEDFIVEPSQFERIVSTAVPSLFGLIVVVGLAGNLVVVLVVALHKRARTATSLLMLNLAVADLVFIVVCVPSTAARYALPVWPFGLVWCKIYQYTIIVTAYASVYTLVLMALDRYLAIVHPITSIKWRTTSRTGIVLIISWVIVCCCNCPSWYRVIEYNYNSEYRSDCINTLVYNSTSRANRRVYYTTFFVIGYALPITVICVLYFLLMRRITVRGRFASGGGGGDTSTAAASAEPTEDDPSTNFTGKRFEMSAAGNGTTGTAQLTVPIASTSSKAARARRRVMRMVTGVVVTFAACWLPFHVAMLVESYHPPSLINEWSVHWFVAFQIFASCLAYLNSCLNPVIYAFVSENFRHSFGELLFGRSGSANRRRRPWSRLQRWKLIARRGSRDGGKVDAACTGDKAPGTGLVGNSEIAMTALSPTGGERLTRWLSRKRASPTAGNGDVRYAEIGKSGQKGTSKSRYALQVIEPIPATVELPTMMSSTFTGRLVGRDPVIVSSTCGGPG